MEWLLDQARTARQAYEDIQIVTSSEDSLQQPWLLMVRFADLTRSNGFLWLETYCKIWEHYHLLPAYRGLARSLVLNTLAADIIVGYLTLSVRKRLCPYLVPTIDWQWQHQRSAQRIRHTAALLGGMLIKACQFASTRPDILPFPYIQALATLQDHVQPHPWPEIAQVLQQASDRSTQQIFAQIEQEPLASASIAQVHRATLLNGREVAVKVQYADIQSIIAIDRAILQKMATEMAHFAPDVQLQPVLDYLQETLPLELDFLREAEAMTDLRIALQHRQDVLIPAVMPELACRQVLVMELVDGIKITDRAALLSAGISPAAVARLLNDVYAEQIFRLGILHADPHPGNLLVQVGPKLVLLDHGLTVRLKPALVQVLREMVQALATLDFERLRHSLIRAGMQFDKSVDMYGLLQLVGVLLGNENDKGKLDAFSMGQQLGRSIGRIPVDLILVGRALGLLNGICRQLDPEVNALEIVARYVA
jgi:predicted unusual protein kinase regulating ubiquinone biosynthesis (AarF/ABC1/UbiB family)